MLQLLFLLSDQTKTFSDKMKWVETELMRMDMAAVFNLGVEHTGRAKMFRAKMQVYDSLDELGHFVGKSDHHNAKRLCASCGLPLFLAYFFCEHTQASIGAKSDSVYNRTDALINKCCHIVATSSHHRSVHA